MNLFCPIRCSMADLNSRAAHPLRFGSSKGAALDFGFSLFATMADQKTKRANRDRLARLAIDSLMPQLFLL